MSVISPIFVEIDLKDVGDTVSLEIRDTGMLYLISTLNHMFYVTYGVLWKANFIYFVNMWLELSYERCGRTYIMFSECLLK